MYNSERFLSSEWMSFEENSDFQSGTNYMRSIFSVSRNRLSLNLGCAMLMMAKALSRVDLPLILTRPYSVQR